jgi:hypothetical protein
MATETTKLESYWRRWRGTPVDIAKIAKRAEELAEAAGIEGHDARVKVVHAHGSHEYSSAKEAAEGLPNVDLRHLDKITMLIGDVLGDFRIGVYFFQRGTMLDVEGHGDKRLAVRGVFEDLKATLDVGSRDVPHEFARGGVASAIAFALVGVSILGTEVFDGPKWLAWLSFASLPFTLVASWFFWMRGLFVPHREILNEGDQARSERWGGRAAKLLGWSVTLVAGGIIGALIAKWIG